jgi:hypothetical protein
MRWNNITNIQDEYNDSMIRRILEMESGIPISKPRIIPAKKRPANEFKVRWQFRNNLNQKTFKISKKFWLDIEWCYKVKYIESGGEHIFTESHFRSLIEQSRFQRINHKVDDKEHFNDNELFTL